MISNIEKLQEVTEIIEESGVVDQVALDNAFPLDCFQQAFEKSESGRMRGEMALDLSTN